MDLSKDGLLGIVEIKCLKALKNHNACLLLRDPAKASRYGR